MKEKIYLNVYIPKSVLTNYYDFLIEDFFQLPPVSTTPLVHLELRKSRESFRKKYETSPNGIPVLRGWGELKSKISWHGPFKSVLSTVFAAYLADILAYPKLHHSVFLSAKTILSKLFLNRRY